MPYILREARQRIDSGKPPRDPGELNYTLTKVICEYLGTSPGYTSFAEAISALECAKLELYRRAVAPYEDYKARSNGDVFDGFFDWAI